MHWGLLSLTFLAGAGLVVQVAMNSAIGAALGRPILGAVMNFVVGLGHRVKRSQARPAGPGSAA
jgi:uncharacterized membrane protein YdcZ (DUF606 family)